MFCSSLYIGSGGLIKYSLPGGRWLCGSLGDSWATAVTASPGGKAMAVWAPQGWWEHMKPYERALLLNSLVCFFTVTHLCLILVVLGCCCSALSSPSVGDLQAVSQCPTGWAGRPGQGGGWHTALAKQICRKSYWLLLNQSVQLGEHREADELWVTQALLLGTDLDPRGFCLCCRGSCLARSAA